MAALPSWRILTKKVLSAIPGGSSLIRGYRRIRLRSQLGGFETAESLFTRYYRDNFWGIEETVSGSGSTIAYTEKVRHGIEEILAELQISSVLDAPCGDYNWFRLVRRPPGMKYIGADIVKPLIEENNARYADDNTRFINLDLTSGPLPAADLLICRDLLFHLSLPDIQRVLLNIRSSEVKYVLLTSYTNVELNEDVPTGSFFFVNLQRPPFNFPEPMRAIDDWVDPHPIRHLCLWERRAIPQPGRKASNLAGS